MHYIPGLEYIGECSSPNVNNGQTVPLYTTNSFINTLAGWNLLATKDNEAYKQARATWESLHTQEERTSFEKGILNHLIKLDI